MDISESSRAAPKIFTIPPDRPFVDVMADYLLMRYRDEPLQLPEVLLLLPTRRACRAMQEALLRASHGMPLLMPRMKPIGDVDDEEMSFSALSVGEGEHAPISSVRRQLLLTRIVYEYQRARHVAPPDISHAANLARELIGFLDDMAREELSFERLADIVPEEFATHWQLTLEFLLLISRQWPLILEEEKKQDPVRYRSAMIRRQAEIWEKAPPPQPVIAAGSTGSIPATAALLKVIAHLPQGMVILPGLDMSMREEAWELIEPTHPQFGLKQLLGHLEVRRQQVETFHPGTQDSNADRFALLQTAMQPADLTHGWRDAAIDIEAGTKGLRRIDAATAPEEAAVIALLMRESLDKPGNTAVLITPDRALARQVAVALSRFGVEIDDSSGMPLSQTPTAVFMRLINDVVLNQFAPVQLLALLKHPYASLGMSRLDCLELTRQLEIDHLRGIRPAAALQGIMALVENEELKLFLQKLHNVFQDLLLPFARDVKEKIPCLDLIQAHIRVAESLASSDVEAGNTILWRGEAGGKMQQFLAEWQSEAAALGDIEPLSYALLFETLLSQEMYRPRYGKHPRLQILSPQEARLQLYDRVILGGLNEGTWPGELQADPWMSRPMRLQAGFPAAERAIGMSAHDFVTLSSAPDVILTRAQKVEGTPTIASRWLMRLETLLAAKGKTSALVDPRWTHWARLLDAPEQVTPITMPRPCPPVAIRPRQLSVTRIERLMRDPYSIYAQKILRLNPLDGLDEEPDAADFGNIVHAAIEHCYREHNRLGLEQLITCGQKAFDPFMHRPAVAVYWWPRYRRIAAWLAEQEAERVQEIKSVLFEIEGKQPIHAPGGIFTLTAKADRIECLKEGGIAIIDYKTGTVPATNEVKAGLACQLPLEAWMAEEGAFGEQSRAAVSSLEYWKLSGGRVAGEITLLQEKKLDLRQLVEEAEEGVKALIAAFDDPKMPYAPSLAGERKLRFNDYEHLSRADEWGS